MHCGTHWANCHHKIDEDFNIKLNIGSKELNVLLLTCILKFL